MTGRSGANNGQTSNEAQDADLFNYQSEESEVGSAEDTDDASETENYHQREVTELKEQMYLDRLEHLKKQLEQLEEGVYPDYCRRLKKVDQAYRERMRMNTVVREVELAMVEQDYQNEKKSAAREFEEKKVLLKEQLIAELEEKQKMIESERTSMELTGDSMELKPINTRKLRRRGNEPTDARAYPGDKRRKQNQVTLNHLLEDSEINEDIKIINKTLSHPKQPGSPQGQSGPGGSSSSYRDSRIDNGKLFYEKRWYRRGQTVHVEHTGNNVAYEAVISAVANEAIWVRKQEDGYKQKICLAQLNKGRIILKRRAT